jgi:hypothetical protein
MIPEGARDGTAAAVGKVSVLREQDAVSLSGAAQVEGTAHQ